ncbi:CoxG family protein [Acuticoccus kandeliae]|uniref:CoxG family protein n=1 Tax=Acuticoccus kandeliae TaxID=2073160 RepID=UPI0013006A44|nr:carbon monoxide dehydrogenase subunit G [Acuticoccus kandeliae]
MELTGEKIIKAPQARVYDALHDPVVLRQSIPGCHSLSKVDDDTYELTAGLKVGPLKIAPLVSVEVYNEDRPAGYSVRGEANANENGSARGNAHVALAAIDAATTNLAYHVTISLKGQLATLERSVLDGTARTLVAEFFSRLQHQIERDVEVVAAPKLAHEPPEQPAAMLETVEDAAGISAPPPREPIDIPPADFDEPGETLAPPRPATQHATTDATGALVLDEPYDDPYAAYGTASSAPPAASAYNSAFSQSRREYAPPDAQLSGGANLWRWFLVIIGIAFIAMLLNGNF